MKLDQNTCFYCGMATNYTFIRLARGVHIVIWWNLIRLCRPLDDITNAKYKLLHFLTTKFFYKEKKALAFNRDRCCHLALCLQLILFPCEKALL
jgi:hypothetical protein